MNRIIAIARVVGIEILRQKALYVLLILMAALLLTISSVNVFGIGGIVRHVQDIGMLAVWMLSWAVGVVLSVRQLPRAEKSGAIYSLLAKPLSRGELLIGKWLGAWIATATAALVFTLLVIAITAMYGGRFDASTTAQAFTLQIAALAMICAAGIALSTAMGEDAALAVTLLLTGGSYFILPRLPYLLATIDGMQSWAAFVFYYCAPHLEWFDMRHRLVHAWGPAPWRAFTAVLIYGALWTGAVLASGWLLFRRKRFNRDTQ